MKFWRKACGISDRHEEGFTLAQQGQLRTAWEFAELSLETAVRKLSGRTLTPFERTTLNRTFSHTGFNVPRLGWANGEPAYLTAGLNPDLARQATVLQNAMQHRRVTFVEVTLPPSFCNADTVAFVSPCGRGLSADSISRPAASRQRSAR